MAGETGSKETLSEAVARSQVRDHEGLIWELLWEVRPGNCEIYYFDIYWTLIVCRMLWEKLTICSNFLCNALICFTTIPVSSSPVSDWTLLNDREHPPSGHSQFPFWLLETTSLYIASLHSQDWPPSHTFWFWPLALQWQSLIPVLDGIISGFWWQESCFSNIYLFFLFYFFFIQLQLSELFPLPSTPPQPKKKS